MKDIEKQAREYRYNEHHPTGHYAIDQLEDVKEFAYLQGSQDRQSEIDLLKSDIEKYRARIRELENGEHVQFMALKNKKEEVEELQAEIAKLKANQQ